MLVIKPLFILVLAALLGTAGCKHRPPAVAVSPSSQTPLGEASFAIVPDPDAPRRELEKNQFYQRPIAKGKLAMPVYPKNALEQRFGAATVAVRIIIGVDGKITDISDSPITLSTSGPFEADFRNAVEEAIRTWTFESAELQQLEDGKDLNGDGKPDFQKVVSVQKIPVYLDLRFDFNIVRGSGQVRAAPAKEAKPQRRKGHKDFY